MYYRGRTLASQGHYFLLQISLDDKTLTDEEEHKAAIILHVIIASKSHVQVHSVICVCSVFKPISSYMKSSNASDSFKKSVSIHVFDVKFLC